MDDTIDRLFRHVSTQVRRKLIVGLWHFFKTASAADIRRYIFDAGKSKGGRPRKITGHGIDYLTLLLRTKKNIKLRFLTAKFRREFFADEQTLSVSTTFRTLKRIRESRKVITRRSILRDFAAQLAWMDFTGFLPSSDIVDMDGMVQNAQDFLSRYGWAPIGQECFLHQIRVGGKNFPVMAAYTEMGFLAWTVFDGTVTSREVEHFVRVVLARFINHSSFLILDNASNQSTDAVHRTLERVFPGRWAHSPQYSPELKPIERGFSNVKRWVQDQETITRLRPVDLIDEAFRVHAVDGPRGGYGGSAWGHFDLYRHNHALWHEGIRNEAAREGAARGHPQDDDENSDADVAGEDDLSSEESASEEGGGGESDDSSV